MDYEQIREELRAELSALQAEQARRDDDPEPDWAKLDASRESLPDSLVKSQLGSLHEQYRVNFETGKRLSRLEQLSARALTTLIDLTEEVEQGR
jgi:hypothetical protein